MRSCMTLFSSIARPIGHRPRRRWCWRRGFGRDSQGAAAVEFGILLPFMVVLLAGIADLGRSIWQHHALQKGVRDAARYLSRVDAPFTTAQLTAAKNLAFRGSFDTSRPYHFAHWASSINTNLDANPTCQGGQALYNAGTQLITVTACVTPPADEFPLISLFGLGSVQYSARIEAINIGE